MAPNDFGLGCAMAQSAYCALPTLCNDAQKIRCPLHDSFASTCDLSKNTLCL
jgi:hypothetical protein